MAIRTIELRHEIDIKKKALESIRKKIDEFATRETELADKIAMATDENREAIENEIAEFTQEKSACDGNARHLEEEISDLEAELEQAEELENPEPVIDEPMIERKEVRTMISRTNFFGMTMEQRDAFMARSEVKAFVSDIKNLRGVTNGNVTIPTVIFDLLKERITDYSKLIKHIRLVVANGNGRLPIAGTIPEAVWTEACGKINELTWGFNNLDINNFKVAGFIPICNALLEDSDVAILTEVVEMLGRAIGIAVDKAILYGTGTKMPMGICTRLAQTSQPSTYPATARAWADLHTSNVITVPSASTELKMFKAIVEASGKAKGSYSTGGKFWAMNNATYTKLMANALGANMNGAIVGGMNREMPVIGGAIEILEFMADDTIVGGYGDLYLLGQRKDITVQSSEHYRFVEDQTVVKGVARYDGAPAIAEGFVAIGLGSAPTMTATFAPDTANPEE